MKTLDKHYEPKQHEDAIYRKWEKSGFFNPDVCVEKGVTKKDAESFSIILPPPNATGILHIGHSVMLAIGDTLSRFHRMRGDKTLWLPGTDHAALATQEKVERLLWDKEKKTRHDLGRDVFLKEVAMFVEGSRDTMRKQMRKMGSSLDWSREAFTLDQKRQLAVNTAFKKMYDDGIIYRGDRIVNWDPKMQTTVSDDEVERQEEVAPFYYFQYGPFIIGTSRPETKFGDKYVVVHPDDERYSQYNHGDTFEVEWVGDTKITATLIKDSVIDKEFGTGAMTITPWHDATDFDIAERHNLDREQIIGYDGKMLKIAGEFSGLNILEARKKIVEKLKEKNLLVKVDEEYIHNIAINERGGGLIEPQIKRQWFIDVNKSFERNGKKTSLKKLMQDAVRNKDVTVIPKRFEKIYFHWIDNLRDWCISRQIWYGHRIPIWYRGEEIYCDTTPPTGEGWKQDSDVLDTWFSSGLWTFSTLGWPQKTQDLTTYHPTTFLDTAYDILFPWVSRMILMSTYLLDEIPFKNVYLHGLVRDGDGKKMSKSLGNVIDPLDVIPKYGTDAVRLSLLIGLTPGNDSRLSEEKIAQYRNFTNKLWNIARFVLSKENATKNKTEDFDISLDSSKWILSNTKILIHEVTKHLENYQFSQAGEKLRDFTWNTFADWYLEITKFEEDTKETSFVLSLVMKDLLKLWHPFMPFVTEALWENLYQEENLLLVSRWPKKEYYAKLLKEEHTFDFSLIIEVIIAIRSLRAKHHISPSRKVPIILSSKNKDILQRNTHLIQNLRTQTSSITVQDNTPEELCLSQTINEEVSLHIPQKDAIDREKEISRIQEKITSLHTFEISLNKRLENPKYLENAPEKIVRESREKLKSCQKEQEQLKSILKQLL
jgi:valyl-tRNA synthetase